jgi:hypothetical protein
MVCLLLDIFAQHAAILPFELFVDLPKQLMTKFGALELLIPILLTQIDSYSLCFLFHVSWRDSQAQMLLPRRLIGFAELGSRMVLTALTNRDMDAET